MCAAFAAGFARAPNPIHQPTAALFVRAQGRSEWRATETIALPLGLLEVHLGA